MLSDAAQRASQERRRRFGSVQAPWPEFVDTVRDEVGKIVVSHRVSKKVSGPMHEETFVTAVRYNRKAARTETYIVSFPIRGRRNR